MNLHPWSVSARACRRVSAAALALAVGAGLLACTSLPIHQQGSTQGLLNDDLFAAPSERIDPNAVFALTPAMQDYARRHLSVSAASQDPRRTLVKALYTRGQLQLDYDSQRTRTAAEAFDARAGNCISLVIMTAAFAKHLGLAVSFQSVHVDEFHSLEAGMLLSSGHVNLVMQRLVPAYRPGRGGDADDLVVDFLPGADLRGQRAVPLPEDTIVAMYLNNRAAEAVTEGRLADAYGWARAAVLQAPRFFAAANTLAVTYLRAGHLAQAETALRHVLAAEPDNVPALTNLVIALQRGQRTEEAQRVAAHLARVQPVPPFHHLALGRQAMDAGDFAAAREHFQRELRLQPYQPEVHFWAAVAHWRLGQPEQAARHLRDAMSYSNTVIAHKRYAGKLDALRAAQVQ